MSSKLKFTPDLAEVCGIHAGDGYLRNKNYKRELDISGSVEEKPYYDAHVVPLFSRVFGIEIKGRMFSSRGTYGFVIRNRKVVETMHELGFPYGKKSLIVRIPKFVLETRNPQIKSAFLRGFFDTDGCLYFVKRSSGKYSKFKMTHHYYPHLSLVSVSKNLIDDLRSLLKNLGIHCGFRKYVSKKKNENISYTLSILGNTYLEKWMTLININNPLKSSRYKLWKKYGHCPSNTTFEERLLMLNEI